MADEHYKWRAGPSGAIEGGSIGLVQLLIAFQAQAATGRFIATNRQGRIVLAFDSDPMGMNPTLGIKDLENMEWGQSARGNQDIGVEPRSVRITRENEEKRPPPDNNDPDFLDWIGDRLVHVHGESPNADFILKLRGVADKLRHRDEK